MGQGRESARAFSTPARNQPWPVHRQHGQQRMSGSAPRLWRHGSMGTNRRIRDTGWTAARSYGYQHPVAWIAFKMARIEGRADSIHVGHCGGRQEGVVVEEIILPPSGRPRLALDISVERSVACAPPGAACPAKSPCAVHPGIGSSQTAYRYVIVGARTAIGGAGLGAELETFPVFAELETCPIFAKLEAMAHVCTQVVTPVSPQDVVAERRRITPFSISSV